MTIKTELRFDSKRIDQLAGEVRNWLLDRLKDGHDGRAWDQRPAEDQELTIDQAQAFGINLVRDIAEAINDEGKQVIKATLGKVTRNGDEVKSDVTLLMHEDDDEDGHAMFSASGKKVQIIVADAEAFTGTEGRPEVGHDQGSLGLGEMDEEEFDRVYLASATSEVADDHLPDNKWPHGQSGGVPGFVWVKEEPLPTEELPFVLGAKRSVDRDADGNVSVLGDFEPPEVLAEWLECERRWAAVTSMPVPDDGLPDNDWQHGQTAVMQGVIWLTERPEPSAVQPIVVDTWRSVERYKNGKIKRLGDWAVPDEAERFDPLKSQDSSTGEGEEHSPEKPTEGEHAAGDGTGSGDPAS